MHSFPNWLAASPSSIPPRFPVDLQPSNPVRSFIRSVHASPPDASHADDLLEQPMHSFPDWLAASPSSIPPPSDKHRKRRKKSPTSRPPRGQCSRRPPSSVPLDAAAAPASSVTPPPHSAPHLRCRSRSALPPRVLLWNLPFPRALSAPASAAPARPVLAAPSVSVASVFRICAGTSSPPWMAASHTAPRPWDGTPARATPTAARRRGHTPRASLATLPTPCNKKQRILGSTRPPLDCLRILDGRRGFPCSSAGTNPV